MSTAIMRTHGPPYPFEECAKGISLTTLPQRFHHRSGHGIECRPTGNPIIMTLLHEDRLFPSDPPARAIAKRLYTSICARPILSPHGHTQASWFRSNDPFPNPAALFIQPDHYVHRMLYSQGVSLEALEIGAQEIQDPRGVWRIFAENYFLFRGTPTRLWLDYAFQELFGLHDRLDASTADLYFDTIAEKLQTPAFRPRALYERFNIEVLATTDSPLDSLADHAALLRSGWKGRVLPTFRPDSVVDPAFAHFQRNLDELGVRSGEDTATWTGYLAALRAERERFRTLGATATDHGHPTARTANLSSSEASALYAKIYSGGGRRAAAGALPRADAHRNGAHEPGRRARHANSSRLIPQPQRTALHEVRPRHGSGHSPRLRTTSTLCGRCCLSSAMTRACASSCSRSMSRPTAASWRRWPDITLACCLGRRGGFTTAPRA